MSYAPLVFQEPPKPERVEWAPWAIDPVESFVRYGTRVDECKPTSHKRVSVVCSACGTRDVRGFLDAHRKHRCNEQRPGKKWCPGCRQWLPDWFYSLNKNSKDGLYSVCKGCNGNRECAWNKERRRRARLRSDLPYYFRRSLRSYKGRASKKGIPFNLVADDLLAVYEKQKGLCFYTGVPMKFHSGALKADSLSLDRVEPPLGYVSSNVVMCLLGVNSFKRDLPLADFRALVRTSLEGLHRFAEQE